MNTIFSIHSERILRALVALLPLVSLLLAVTSVSSADDSSDPTAQYEKANQLYAAGDYKAAARQYEAILRAGHFSADVCYNLGAAKQRLSEDGESTLWMKRALILQPGMPEATQSLTFLRKQGGILEFADTPLRRSILRLSPVAERWLMTLGLWGVAISLVSAFSVRRLRSYRRTLITFTVLLLLLVGAVWRLALYRATQLDAQNFWIAIPDKTEVVSAPIPGAKAVISLPAGSEVRLVQDAGAWGYVEIPGGTRGWVKKDTIAPTWPIFTGTSES